MTHRNVEKPHRCGSWSDMLDFHTVDSINFLCQVKMDLPIYWYIFFYQKFFHIIFNIPMECFYTLWNKKRTKFDSVLSFILSISYQKGTQQSKHHHHFIDFISHTPFSLQIYPSFEKRKIKIRKQKNIERWDKRWDQEEKEFFM